MGFNTKRGRPKTKEIAKQEEKDLGTKELQEKRSRGMTREVIDIVLEKNLISGEQYSAAMHLRWLYTVRFGAPTVSAINLEIDCRRESGRNDEVWQMEREKEYAMAIEKLRAGGSLKIVMNIVVFNQAPKFMNTRRRKGADLAACGQELLKFRDGLTTLVELWNRKHHI